MMFKDTSHRPHERLPDHDLCVAGFPSQPFSPMGSRQGLADQLGRGRIFRNVLAVLSTKRPRAFLLENVKGLVSQHRATFDDMLKQVRPLGNGAYKIGYKIIKTARRGIPQNRERVYIVSLLRDYIVP
ncbi:MAG: DNA (cytosine-5-)-methyltransferase, partial [Candidatus Fonsibacter sp.]